MVSDDAAHAALGETHPATGASRVGPSGRGGGVALQRAQLFLIGVLCLLLNEATIARRERGVFCFACGKTSDSPPSDVSGTR